MTFVYTFPSQQDNNAAVDAITNAYPTATFPYGGGSASGFLVRVPDPVTQNDVDTIVQNATGHFVTADSATADVSPPVVSNPTLPGGSNLTDPLAGIVDWFKKLLASFPSLQSLGIWVAAIVLILLFVIFFAHGAGEGLAAKV